MASSACWKGWKLQVGVFRDDIASCDAYIPDTVLRRLHTYQPEGH